uniref:ATP-dependent Clp protease proteolytic subunit n=1 Tax=Lamprocapnos spectabilis TaxID=54415 RepID=A0A385LMJ3_9MAGN|nr:ATP-dependent Clp protease proteolytic subunit [Lamprocapnos spectabilis]AYA29288.1 ATP-dependent Clp protease proteolytic subunit [Lamprocapnos spectabilis]
MPVGIPKVAFRIPGNEEATWVDLYNRLHRQRSLFIGQALNFEVTNTILSTMIFLTLENRTLDQFVFINCPGGLVLCGIGIYDMMRTGPRFAHTIALGKAFSTGSFLLSGGEFSTRLSFPHARVMVHQPHSSFWIAKAEAYTLDSEEVKLLRHTFIRLYRARTGQKRETLIKDMEKRDSFLTPTEAQIHGIVDLVGLDAHIKALTRARILRLHELYKLHKTKI